MFAWTHPEATCLRYSGLRNCTQHWGRGANVLRIRQRITGERGGMVASQFCQVSRIIPSADSRTFHVSHHLTRSPSRFLNHAPCRTGASKSDTGSRRRGRGRQWSSPPKSPAKGWNLLWTSPALELPEPADASGLSRAPWGRIRSAEPLS